MKKQKFHQVINVLLSAFLVFSMFLTNAGQILVYASEAHTSNEDEEKTNEVIEMDETTSPLQIKTSEEEIQDLEKKFDEVYKDLSLILSEEQRKIVENMINSEELFSLLQEAIVLHEAKEFEESIIYYEDILSGLDEEPETEVISKKLIQEFKELASKEKTLLDYEEIKDENPSEGENFPKEEVEKETINDESTEQEVESVKEEEVSSEEYKTASSVQEETADPILS